MAFPQHNPLEKTLSEFKDIHVIFCSRFLFYLFIDIWLDDNLYSRKRKKGMDRLVPDKRKRPITVSGFYQYNFICIKSF